jgi:hypothetical protein
VGIERMGMRRPVVVRTGELRVVWIDVERVHDPSLCGVGSIAARLSAATDNADRQR